MSRRREFTNPVKAEIVRRATNAQGKVTCEGCGLVLGKRPHHIDHSIPDALVLDKSRKLTAADGKLLGKECCHDPKTRQVDVPAIAEAKRREALDLGIKREKVKIPTRPKFSKPKREQIPPPPRRALFWPARHVEDSGD